MVSGILVNCLGDSSWLALLTNLKVKCVGPGNAAAYQGLEAICSARAIRLKT
jgi:uncharacterized protein YgfB (UPF0149 family)